MRSLAAVGAAAVLVVTGCSADEAGPSTLPPLASGGPSASGSASPSGSPSASVSAAAKQQDRAQSPSAVPSGATSALAAPVPSEALAATPQGASAFARYFFHQINAGYTHLEPERVRRLSTHECGSCAAVAADIRRLSDAAHQVAGRRYIILAAEAAPVDAEQRAIVDFRFISDPYIERDGSGRVVQEFPPEEPRDGQALLVRSDGGWRVSAIRLVQS